jgi:Flp pilus assembly protein TadG
VTVEFALVAPLLFLVVCGAVEFARLNMLVNSMENAAYEGARQGIVPGATADGVRAEAQLVLDAVGARNADVSVSPTVITSSTSEVTVTIRLPLNDNAWVSPVFTADADLERSCTLRRESTTL